MTHSMGEDIVAVTIPLPRKEAALWGRLSAVKGGRSRVELLRSLILAGAVHLDKELAHEVWRIRRERNRKIAATAAACLVTVCLFLNFDMRRTGRTARRMEDYIEEAA